MGTRKWNYAWHNQQIEAFRKEHPVYGLYVSLLRNVLEEFCRRNIPESHTGGRAKGLPSFAEKAIRKVGKYPDPIHQFTDLAGARIVTLTRADADLACQFIRRNFIVDEDNSEDKRKTLGTERFGYRAVHYVVQMPWVGLLGHDGFKEVFDDLCRGIGRQLSDQVEQIGSASADMLMSSVLKSVAGEDEERIWKGLVESKPPIMEADGAAILRFGLERTAKEIGEQTANDRPTALEMMCKIGNRKAEIQVHTLLEHAWAAVSHDHLYKTSFQPPPELERQLVRVAALLEESDEQFSQTLSAINQYQADYGKYMSPEDIEEEIAKWRAVAGHMDQDIHLAVKVAHYASALPDPDWGLVVEMLGPHGESRDCRVLRLLGTANARLHGHGRPFLEKAHTAAPNDLVSLLLLGDTYCPECDLCERGPKGRRSGDCQKALRHYTEAFAATFPSDPRRVCLSVADPHIFRKFAECLICSGRSHEVSLLEGPALAIAWSISYRRSEVHYKAPESLYDMGFFTLLLNRPLDSLSAYARAVFLSPDEKPIVAELGTLNRLHKRMGAFRQKPAWAQCLRWAVWFLTLAKVAKVQQRLREIPDLIRRREDELKARRDELDERKAALASARKRLAAVKSTRAEKPPATNGNRWNGGELPLAILMSDIQAQAERDLSGANAALAEARNAVKRAEAALDASQASTGAIKRQADRALAEFRRLQWHNVSSHRRKLPIHPGAGPIVIMVGSCDPTYESILQNYQPVLMKAFERFSGLICSGGTRAGIGALVGDIQAAFPKAVTTLGYLPHLQAGIKAGKIEAWVKRDKRYSFLLTTATDEFGPEQPLQYWTDLLAAGVEPYHVKVLGVNGGKIAALEYRMALALNAPVAVLEKSGREAARLLQNDDWGVAERLMVLPPEMEMIRAYIRSGSAKMPRRLTRLLDRIARDVHEDYVKLRHKQIQKEDLSLSGWSRLPPDLQDSNRQQAVHLADHLSLMGYALANRCKGRDQAAEFVTDDIERIAEIEHARYVIERFLEGWKWGEKKEVEKKINPTLVAWSKLPDKEKEKDRVAARNIPKHFAKGDVRIVRKEDRTT